MFLPPGVTKSCSKTEDEIRAEAALRTKRDIDAVLAATCITPSPDLVFEIAMRHYSHYFHVIEEAATTFHGEGAHSQTVGGDWRPGLSSVPDGEPD